VSSGGNECARSSRRGASLASSSLGGTLDSDGPQSHAVVTQKRKLRTPVWARLRNIHISDPHLNTQIRYRIRSRRTWDLILPLSVSPVAHPLNPIHYPCADNTLWRVSLSNDRFAFAHLERQNIFLWGRATNSDIFRSRVEFPKIFQRQEVYRLHDLSVKYLRN